MPCSIERVDDHHEVRVHGDTSEHEILDTVMELRNRDPEKDLNDLWILEPGSTVPIFAFQNIVTRVKAVCPDDTVTGKSAIVAPKGLRYAVAELYIEEADSLPFETKVFSSREAALRWFGHTPEAGREAASPLPSSKHPTR